MTRWSQPRRARAGLGRSYQRTTIFAEFSVLENCRLARAGARRRGRGRIWRAAAQRRATASRPRSARSPPPASTATPARDRRHAQPRRQAPARDRDVPGDRAARAAARRAARRHGRRRDRRMLALLAELKAHARDPAGRARHGRGVPHRRPHHRDGQRRGDRERRARAHPQRPRGAASPTSATRTERRDDARCSRSTTCTRATATATSCAA